MAGATMKPKLFLSYAAAVEAACAVLARRKDRAWKYKIKFRRERSEDGSVDAGWIVLLLMPSGVAVL